MHEMKMLTNFYSSSMNGVAIMIENYRLSASTFSIDQVLQISDKAPVIRRGIVFSWLWVTAMLSVLWLSDSTRVGELCYWLVDKNVLVSRDPSVTFFRQKIALYFNGRSFANYVNLQRTFWGRAVRQWCELGTVVGSPWRGQGALVFKAEVPTCARSPGQQCLQQSCRLPTYRQNLHLVDQRMKSAIKFGITCKCFSRRGLQQQCQSSIASTKKLYGAVHCCAPSSQALPMPDPLWDFSVCTSDVSSKSIIKSMSQSP